MRAKAKGVHMGRPPKLTPHQWREAIERRERGDTLMDIAQTLRRGTYNNCAALTHTGGPPARHRRHALAVGADGRESA